MATSADYLTFVLEKLSPMGVVRRRKMFGEYMVYFNEKPVLLVCDNTVFVKKLPVLDNLMYDTPCGYPYEGAKEHYMLDVEDRELTEQVLRAVEAATQLPKPRKKNWPLPLSRCWHNVIP